MTRPRDADGFAGGLADDHDLSRRARAYGEAVVRGGAWPLSALDLERIEWATSTRARRRNGWCRYAGDGGCTVTVGEHVRDRAGFEALRETIRHELVHAWQHQHAGDLAAIGDGTPIVLDGDVSVDEAPVDEAVSRPADRSDVRTVEIGPGHGPTFRAWVDLLDLEGRCSSPYDRAHSDYAYVLECPACGDWWGRHRLCKSVRQAAHGREGTAGYRYCVDCETLVHLLEDGRYLRHGDHDDEAIRAFADGDLGGVQTVHPDRLTPSARPAADD